MVRKIRPVSDYLWINWTKVAGMGIGLVMAIAIVVSVVIFLF